MLVNGVGAVATGITVSVVLVAKFVQGAWMTMLLIPMLFLAMLSVNRYYRRVKQQIHCASPIELQGLRPPKVVIPVQSWSQISKDAVQFALTISRDVHAVHVAACEDDPAITPQEWEEFAAEPARRAGFPVPDLITIPSPYRFIILPIVHYVLQLERSHPDRLIAVLIPEMVERKWYEYLLHNQRGELLRLLLFAKGNRRVVTVTVPWYLDL